LAKHNDVKIANALMRYYLVASQEVLGNQRYHEILESSGLERLIENLPPDGLDLDVNSGEFARFNQEIESRNKAAGRSLLRRIGMLTFQKVMRDQPFFAKSAGVVFKLLPQDRRIRVVLDSLVRSLEKLNPQIDASIEEEDGKIAYVERRCSVCFNRKSTEAICYINAGFLTAAVNWATARRYEIIETHCIAMGDEKCRFEVRELTS